MTWTSVFPWIATGLIAASCSANSEKQYFGDQQDSGTSAAGSGGVDSGAAETSAGGTTDSGGLSFAETGGGGGQPSTTDCVEAAKNIYLFTRDRALYAFKPDVEGMDAYSLVGPVTCSTSGSPQSMAVDRSATAYVFYDSGELFTVSTADGSCSPTSYKHPAGSLLEPKRLGMGFTASAPDSKEQRLYVISPSFGLATVDTSSYALDMKNVLKGETSELTGGPDAKLFSFVASSATLNEITQDTWDQAKVRAFNLKNVGAWAFARYGGKFFVFTAPQAGLLSTKPSVTTVYDPADDSEVTRDADLGFTVVGAGQSTCVPPPPPK